MAGELEMVAPHLLSQFFHTQVSQLPDIWFQLGPHSLVPPGMLAVQ